MSGGSLGIRSASYGSLEKQLQNGFSPIQTGRKQVKMVKEKERLFHWICKFAGRKKVGMLFLCVISAAVFVWVLYVGKGEDSQEGNGVQNISVNESMSIGDSPSIVSAAKAIASNLLLPPSYFLGYNLPLGHPCNSFTLPPPPADKKRTGPRPCPVCYLPVDEAIKLMPKSPSPSPVLKNLTFTYEENLSRDGEFGGSDFGGYPTLKQRNDSFDIRESMCVHCGFVRGIKPGRNTGFDMDEDDLLDMEQCRGIVVASAVFGNFDEINEPKNVSEYSKQTVCFLMFVDEETEKYLTSSGRLGTSKKIGLWRIIVARNLPYTDARRTGKIPKLLLHRMAPNAHYSIWLDGKLELVVDPYQILERFLWRTNATFAISKHYRRFDVFVEAEANKAAAKYDNASIDFQINFYKNEGLTPYSEAKLPLISDVPEGCVIIREHVPISNLFTCLWFGEVDRFTSRDQISFSTVRDKFLSQVDFHFHMFLDCERRNFVVHFDLRSNDLSGEIPQTGSFSNQGPTAFLNNPKLCGFPLQKQCTGSAPSEPGTSPGSARQHVNRSKKGLSPGLIIIITVADAAGVALIGLLVVYVYWKKKDNSNGCSCTLKRKFGGSGNNEKSSFCCFCLSLGCVKGFKSDDSDIEESEKGGREGGGRGEGEGEGELVAIDKGFSFELDELLRASAYVLGKSGLGIVYKVVLGNGVPVAVRRLGEGGEQRYKEFAAEVQAIGKVKHPNIVKLRAYYWAHDEKLLISDFISNGNLANALRGRNGQPSPNLSWSIRLRIVKGTARGLAYLHECSPRKFVHGDLKPSNILLDADFQPLISDFGLNRLISITGNNPSTGGFMGGALPYLKSSQTERINNYKAPEARVPGCRPTQKWDVYSFGVVLLELLTGKSPDSSPGASTSVEVPDLVRWVKKGFEQESPLSEMVDPSLLQEIHAKKEVLAVFHVALSCTEGDPEVRPRMKTVSDNLERI